MDALDLARWQFGITTVYHFFFVPMTISMGFLVAIMQTRWRRSGDERWLRLTRFFGKLFLINFAMGVVTGIVQEFQFGMNWSAYSRFVGDIFGAPLAMEALVAFFLESTFLGLWIFGWDKLKPGVHLATIWLAATGTLISSFFILAANSWMQNPTGFKFNAATGRAELSNFIDVLTNKVGLVTIPHVVFAAFMVGGGFVAGVSLWSVLRRPGKDTDTFVKGVRFGAVTLLVAGLGVIVTGDIQGKIMTDVQPMKMASAEALYNTEQPAGFSILTVGTPDGKSEKFSIKVPKLLSFLATGSFNGKVQGINQLEAKYQDKFGGNKLTAMDSYTPNIPVTYWSFRWMIGFGFAAMAVGAWMLVVTRKNAIPSLDSTKGGIWLLRSAIVLPLLPLLGNSFGWIFTEMGRQPWIVFGQMGTKFGVSGSVSAFEVGLTLVGFTAIYGALAVVEVKLLLDYIKKGLPDANPPAETPDDTDAPLAFAY